jgi:hypothetical protein
MFSNCMLDNGAMENNRVIAPNLIQTRGSSQIPCSVAHSEDVQKGDNSKPSHLICMAHVRHVDPKWMMHMFCYSTYAFNKNS